MTTPGTRDPILTVDAFVRSVAVNRNAGHALFLGAGASISSNIPSADTCLWNWKKDIFLTNNPGLGPQFDDILLPSARTRIQRWLDGQGEFPLGGSLDEYGYYAERCYPILQDRRQYFQRLIAGKEPYVGYQLLCLLAEAELIKSVWTTNFDGLTGRAAAASKVTAIEIGLDTSPRIDRPQQRGDLLTVALHGDFRYDALKNTSEELREQDDHLRQALIQHIKNTTLIVIGYSGRDKSVMDALSEAYSERSPGRLFWCGYGETEPTEEIRKLLELARSRGREAYYVATAGFDDIMVRLASHCLTGELRDRSQAVCARYWAKSANDLPPFSVPLAAVTGIIKSNAFAIELPREIIQVEATGYDQPGAWQHLRDEVGSANIVAGLQGGKILALGTTEEIRRVFADSLIGNLSFAPIIERELAYSDGVVISLLSQALVRSMAAVHGLHTDGRLLWAKQSYMRQVVYGVNYHVHRAAKVYLRRYAGKDYVVIKPTVKGLTNDGGELSAEADKELKRAVLTKQYNRLFNEALEHWRNLLFPSSPTTFEFPAGSGSQILFYVQSAPVYAGVSSAEHGQPRLSNSYERFISQRGTEYREPRLRFSNRLGNGSTSDVHPLRGLIQNKPHDYSLTLSGISPSARLAVICPAKDARLLASYLAKLHMRSQASSKLEYLVDYPGFSSALGLPLEIPQPGDIDWIECPEPTVGQSSKGGALELGRRITRGIENLKAASSSRVVVIYIPERWRQWERYSTEGEYFDLHDFVKAYAVEQGIATQFLREATLSKRHQCEVLWWLALALYVKSMRTPWILENLDAETAYMGLGFSLDPRAPRGEHVLLGCSHIYNARGQGLQYRLTRLENSVMRQKNPFMSRDDARRMGENVRQLFYESTMALPKRVVIHKRTPFNREEREGLVEGLSGVNSIDMIEISTDKALRYVASEVTPEGRLREDGYPIRRGTTVVLDRRHALLWVHGTATPVDARKRYYQGKSRIPAPLTITRHYGTSSLGTIATEILGLSKMDWNSFDMYDKEPATIQSSNRIAKVGALLQRLGNASYDYRLFI